MRIAWAVLVLPAAAFAHDFAVTRAVAVFDAAGAFQIDVSADIDALALGLDPTTDSALVAARMRELDESEFDQAVERAKDALRASTRVEFGRREAEFEVSFPQHGTAAAASAETPTVLGALARLRGRTSLGPFRFRADPMFKVVHLTIFDPRSPEPTRFVLEPGETSPSYDPGGARQGAFGRYFALGFEHIAPKGLDHILFVLGLFLLNTRLRPLFWQVTAFTIAHSATLALSMFGAVDLPSRLVETLIAASIAYVAAENVVTSELKPWRPALVFGFGLLHGLGFAGVLTELGLPRDEFLPALIAFNLGVEAGQLAVIAVAYVLVARFRHSPNYRRAIVVPASAAIAAVGLYWAFERALG